ncbi:uncharacterized protein BP01DRAFT_83618 [Aspergillus saccharolyticus JOP 1030-1]|uniref:Uncharacterized protein n=1 Tax=Aspergillus saccharolyticus JOP 1030-1 TaxID=1450539 RepID=A0A318ZAZ4_9EURO|nr:hypothetical protein BP01DRAFT_83618 [Aspergillus saccharolyticus JOP 1030-1]PYH44469.1 hypothetical protein BP01DRAFT_83618 [Aspergillus saccharolyticus JOP 1030-1]
MHVFRIAPREQDAGSRATSNLGYLNSKSVSICSSSLADINRSYLLIRIIATAMISLSVKPVIFSYSALVRWIRHRTGVQS